MDLHWTIIKTNTGWALKCTQRKDGQIVTRCRTEFLKLVDAIQAANWLQVHIDNASALPISKV